MRVVPSSCTPAVQRFDVHHGMTGTMYLAFSCAGPIPMSSLGLRLWRSRHVKSIPISPPTCARELSRRNGSAFYAGEIVTSTRSSQVPWPSVRTHCSELVVEDIGAAPHDVTDATFARCLRRERVNHLLTRCALFAACAAVCLLSLKWLKGSLRFASFM